MRLQPSVSATNNSDTSHVYIKRAFLEATLDEEIWLSMPAALCKDIAARKIVIDINAPVEEILQRRRTLYGLKQSGLN